MPNLEAVTENIAGQLLEQLSNSISQQQNATNIPCRLYIVGSKLREGTKTRYDVIEPLEIIIDDSVQEWLLSSAKSTVDTLQGLELLEMSETDESGEGIKRYLELTELSELAEWKNCISTVECDSAHETINQDDFKPKVFICHIQIGNQDFYLVKGISETVFLKQRKVMKFIPARGSYQLEEETGSKKIFLDDNWDALLLGDYVVLLNESRVLDLFRYYEKFKEAAEQTLSEISSMDFIADMENIRGFVSERVLFQKKLARAGSTYPMDEVKIERIKELISGGTINLRLNEEGKIECTSTQEMRVVLDVLMDNFVSSLITDEQYKAINKSKLQAGR
ncbi:Kiwa anti-phage protein KwaB-like domain-containing protein [Paenibacillus rigui]|uniref:DUF4868 domain-containing protein n=1 Tax=Paenibacillus rigui TaxID=554312 RepID=A0A229UGJ7_9BACL|nr:Kiwa anti-phage protein KwaB-like domain-containing protein [Paenibacillus rigui]OXM82524.1 DUF4868 domain-containing protein [Paenibacillus rigui]